MYLDIFRMQRMAHISVQENDFDLRCHSWERFMPLYFALNMTNYARYGSYYVEILNCIDQLYPGMKDMLKTSGLSSQSQDRYPLRTPIDQRGEQTINRHAKTPGGVKSLVSNQNSILKWRLNRSDVATNTRALKELAGTSKEETIYKQLRPAQILLSESLVAKVMDVLQSEYVHPFDPDIDNTKLFHLSSGIPVSDDTADGILSTLEMGSTLYEQF